MKLFIDTSKPEAVISLKEEESTLAERRFTVDRTIGQKLLESLDSMLLELSKVKKDITSVSVNTGPLAGRSPKGEGRGSFMALRTGIVTAQTLAQALQLPMAKVQPRYE